MSTKEATNSSIPSKLSLLCLFECQQKLAYISAGYLGIIIIVIVYLYYRCVVKMKKAGSGRRQNRDHSTSHFSQYSQSSWSSHRGLNDSFDTDSVTSSVIYGSSGV
jgi:hypothetical protein